MVNRGVRGQQGGSPRPLSLSCLGPSRGVAKGHHVGWLPYSPTPAAQAHLLGRSEELRPGLLRQRAVGLPLSAPPPPPLPPLDVPPLPPVLSPLCASAGL